MPNLIVFAFGLFAFIVVLSVWAIGMLLMRPWLRAVLYGTPVSFPSIVLMRLRGNPPMLLIDAYITLKRADVSLTIADVENSYIDNKNQITTSDDLVDLVKNSEFL